MDKAGSPIEDRLQYWYDRCKLWPEDTADGRSALLSLRNMTPEAILVIRRLRKELDELKQRE